MIQNALMCAMLCSISRAMARVFRSVSPVGPGRWPSSLPSGMKSRGMTQLKSRCGRSVTCHLFGRDSACNSRSLIKCPTALLRRLHVAVEHRRVGVDAEAVGGAMDFEPAVRADLAFEDFIVHAVVEDLRAAAGQAAEAGFAQGDQHFADAQPAMRVKWTISMAVNALMCSRGHSRRMPRSMSR